MDGENNGKPIKMDDLEGFYPPLFFFGKHGKHDCVFIPLLSVETHHIKDAFRVSTLSTHN